jgi:hypothetical protein
MRRRARTVVALLLIGTLVLGSPPRSDAGIIPDPGDIAQLLELAKIIDALQKMYRFLHKINDEVRDVRTRLRVHFPLQALGEIRTTFQTARTIQDEIKDLSCAWRFSVRTSKLRLALQGLGGFCRNEYQFLFGAALPGPDQDLKEARQWAGTLRYKQVADQIRAAKDLADDAQAISWEARQAGDPDDPTNPHSVAYSTRLMALAEADSLKAAASLNGLAALDLEAVQEDLDASRREDWQQDNAARLQLFWLTQYKDAARVAAAGARP